MIVEREALAADEVNEAWIPVYKSDVHEGETEVSFRKLQLNLNYLTQGNNHHRIRFSIYSFDANDKEEKGALYGCLLTTVNDLMNNFQQERELINNKALIKVAGTISFSDFIIINQPSFVEYLKSGWFINLSVAIDFTASNGERHNVDLDGELNDYECAILEVGNILEPYAYKKKFAGFGFGGIPTYQNIEKVSHCFNLNGQNDPTIDGLENVLDQYRKAQEGTTLWGPTHFENVLKMIL